MELGTTPGTTRTTDAEDNVSDANVIVTTVADAVANEMEELTNGLPPATKPNVGKLTLVAIVEEANILDEIMDSSVMFAFVFPRSVRDDIESVAKLIV